MRAHAPQSLILRVWRADFSALLAAAGQMTIGSSIGFVTRLRVRILASPILKIFQWG
jgi:hypothetical protein